jgi:hypothetical protein
VVVRCGGRGIVELSQTLTQANGVLVAMFACGSVVLSFSCLRESEAEHAQRARALVLWVT